MRNVSSNVRSFNASILTLLIINSIELIVGIISLLFFLSPQRTEKRVKQALHCFCCCIIRNDELIDSLVSGIMSLPSFDAYSMTDVLAGLHMTNLVYHHKGRIINMIPDPQERLLVKRMRVHEYLAYLHQHADQLKEGLQSSSWCHEPSMSAPSTDETLRDEKGEECVVLGRRNASDLFDHCDVELGFGSSVMKRLTYGITKDRLTVSVSSRSFI